MFSCDVTAYNYVTSRLRHFCGRNVERRRRHRARSVGDSDNSDLMAYFYRTSVELTANDRESGLTPELVYEGLGDVLRAGSSTGTSLLAWIIQYLALHQRAQQQIFEEVTHFVTHRGCHHDGDVTQQGCHGKAIVVMEKESHPKCLSFIYETMRVTSLLPYLRRRVLDGIQLFGYTVPKGSMVILNSDSTNNDPSVFSDPEHFRPWRFLSEEGFLDKGRLKQYIPFGLGRRRCPGDNLGLQMTLSGLSTLVRNFLFIQHPEHQLPSLPVFGISLAPTPFTLIVRKRKM